MLCCISLLLQIAFCFFMLFTEKLRHFIEIKVLEIDCFKTVAFQLPTGRFKFVNDTDAVRPVTVRILHVAVRIDTDQAGHLHIKPGLLFYFSDGSHLGRFTYFDRPARKSPLFTVSAALEQNPSVCVKNTPACENQNDFFVTYLASDPTYIVF